MTRAELIDYGGYSSSIFPGITHVFQSAAMRFGHTLVTPGIWRRTKNDTTCYFGTPYSYLTFQEGSLQHNGSYMGVSSWKDLVANGSNYMSPTSWALFQKNLNPDLTNYEESNLFALRTCNAFWNGPVYIREPKDIEPMLEGMASQLTEREDFIITEDLRGFVFGPLEFSRRDLMAVNILRGRDHGLPGYAAARKQFRLDPVTEFSQINLFRGFQTNITEHQVLREETLANLERLRVVYNNDLNTVDIWAGGLLETDFRGPGTLFTAIIFDQFDRIRRSDRFWFQNELNELFTTAERDWILNITIRDLLQYVTDIDMSGIQADPFIFSPDPAHCPQPFQLSQLWMDQCLPVGSTGTNIEYGDLRIGFSQSLDFYYSNAQQWYSVGSHPLVVFIIFAYILMVATILGVLAFINKRRRLKVIRTHVDRQKTVKAIGEEITYEDDGVVMTELKGDPSTGRDRPVRVSLDVKKKTIHLYFQAARLRKIDLTAQQEKVQLSKVRNKPMMVLKFEIGYDLALEIDTPDIYTKVEEQLIAFFDAIGVGVVRMEESSKREAIRHLYTYQKRQKDIEAFFKAIFAQESRGSDTQNLPENITNLQLTKEEFAAVMGLKVGSVFVEYMFDLADKDGSGTISFREFLEIFIAFHKGTADEKLELIFRMYDVNNDQTLDKKEFKNMLKSMMDLVRADVAGDKLDKVVNEMFKTAGFENKEDGALSFNDFKNIMEEHKHHLESATLDLKGIDVAAPATGPGTSGATKEPEITPAEGATDGGEADGSSRNRYARARKTVHHAYRSAHSRTTYGKQAPAAENNPNERRTQLELPKTVTLPIKLLKFYLRFMENYKRHIFWLILFYLVTIWIFAERAYFFSVEREHIGLRRITGLGVSVTRGAASVQMFHYSLLLVTMSRNIITMLRETMLNKFIPFDTYISFHKNVAITAMFGTLIHCIGHAFNFYHIATENPNDLTCFFREYFHRTHRLIKFSYWVFETITGLTAVALVLQLTLIYTFSTQYARRYVYQSFWLVHNTYPVWYILMILHGMGRLVQDPIFGNFLIGPALIFIFDKLISYSRRKIELAVVKAHVLPSLVTGIYLKKPPGLEYQSGQWARIALKAKGFYGDEYHSFTISSAPHEEFLSFHIRSVGPWTYNFRDYFQQVNEAQSVLPKVYMEGPWGEGHQEWFRFEVSVLVGGGIGVTPFASILKDIVHKNKVGANIACKKILFIWVTRTQKQWEWFLDIIREAEENDANGILENHIYITAFFDKFDLRTTMLYVVERDFQRLAGQSLFTGSRAVTHFGRPNFVDFFNGLSEDYFEVPAVGVFSCGPPGMTKSVEEACSVKNRFEGPAFLHHYENF
eukprot:TRINITY_DN2278_c0_g1_i2.p1 TRINITY_DN2278_c0_g1~~TRINITY_DN2278_c0_g1_i2.p1  ORF type:complete len:1347 (-),score=312.94 TRINITY_DN2278_c0_g1_i2:157-4197(-)